MKKIVLIGCYFGALRKDYKIWLRSCKNNTSIDWLIFSDCNWNDTPSNVKIIHKSFNDMKKIIQSKFDFTISLEQPYKLCDYKPAYGYIFEDYITNYDIWGYCDFDMIFGDIRKFITEDILEKYDKIYTLGHLSFYKNNYENNRVFKCKNSFMDYKNVFTTEEIKVFDERKGINKIFLEKNKKVYDNNEYLDLSKFTSKILINNGNKYKNNYRYQTILYNKGKIYYIYKNKKQIYTEEKVYVHFSGKNMLESNNSDCFLITHSGIKNVDNFKDMTSLKIDKLYFYDIICLYEYIKRQSFRVKRKIKKIKYMKGK